MESIREDREVKPLSYAKARVPLYLLIDRFREPVTITMFADPTDDGYASAISVPAGSGEELWVPDPIRMVVPAATVPPLGMTTPTQA